jgi:hypothetical protein
MVVAVARQDRRYPGGLYTTTINAVESCTATITVLISVRSDLMK